MAYPPKTDRASILAAALEQVENEGIESLAIRTVAAKLNLAPNALYRYFENLSALEAEVAEEVRVQMLEALQKAVGDKNSSDTIIAISETYLEFAQRRPNAFALYLKNSGTPTPQCECNTQFLVAQVARVYGEEQATVAAHMLWAQIHGLAVLLGAGVVNRDEAYARLRSGLESWTASAAKTHL